MQSYLLVALGVALSDGPGSGPDHPAPHSLAVFLGNTTTHQTFQLRGRTEVMVRPAGQVLSPAGQQGALQPLLQDNKERKGYQWVVGVCR